jgi:hypothetical protein
VLWLHLARRRAQQNDVEEFTRNAAKVNLDIWPGQLVAFQLGKRPLRDFAAVIRSVDACEAPFHLGESLIRQGNHGKARALLRAHGVRELRPRSVRISRRARGINADGRERPGGCPAGRARRRRRRESRGESRSARRGGRGAPPVRQALDKGGLTKGDRALVLEKRARSTRPNMIKTGPLPISMPRLVCGLAGPRPIWTAQQRITTSAKTTKPLPMPAPRCG